MPPSRAKGTVARNCPSSKYFASESESFHSVDVFVEIVVHSSSVGCRMTRWGLCEDGRSSLERSPMVLRSGSFVRDAEDAVV